MKQLKKCRKVLEIWTVTYADVTRGNCQVRACVFVCVCLWGSNSNDHPSHYEFISPKFLENCILRDY